LRFIIIFLYNSKKLINQCLSSRRVGLKSRYSQIMILCYTSPFPFPDSIAKQSKALDTIILLQVFMLFLPSFQRALTTSTFIKAFTNGSSTSLPLRFNLDKEGISISSSVAYLVPLSCCGFGDSLLLCRRRA
jgi:hypothetical protein